MKVFFTKEISAQSNSTRAAFPVGRICEVLAEDPSEKRKIGQHYFSAACDTKKLIFLDSPTFSDAQYVFIEDFKRWIREGTIIILVER